MVLDASICVSFLASKDEFHLRTVEWLQHQTAVRAAFFAPTLLLVDVAGVLARLTGRSDVGRQAIVRLRETIDIQFVPLDRDRAESYARLAADLRLRGADATYVAVAREIGVPLVTWDREQRSRAAEIVRVLTPTSVHQDDSSG
ncbi:MAG: type II toxin-antitoxin system VapC family toxin [Thermomicrobiales bacterium]